MTRRIVLGLAVLLCLQLAAVALLYLPDQQNQTSEAAPLLTAGSAAAVNGLRITDDGGASVALARADDGWQLADTALPADSARVTALLDVLLAPPGWPVAQSRAAQERFAVGEAGFQRRIDAAAEGAAEQTVFLGTAPGFRRIHARAAGSNAIYSLAFNAYDAPADAGDWLQRSLLQPAEITALILPDLTAQSTADGWQTAAGEPVDSTRCEELAEALRTLRVTGLADEAVAGTLDGAQNALQLTAVADGREMRFLLAEWEDQRFIRSDRYAYWFMISRYDYERIAEALAPPAPDASSNRQAERSD